MTAQSSPPAAHKAWARHLRAVVGGDCAVTSYHDDARQNTTHIFTSVNGEGLVAATIGLQDTDQSDARGDGLFIEIIMDRRGADERVANVLSTIAFYIIKDGWRVRPGAVFESMVQMYFPETPLPHVMFTTPFQWPDMSRVELDGTTVYPLLAVPISEAERQFAATHGSDALESLWEGRSVDVLDWERRPVTFR